LEKLLFRKIFIRDWVVSDHVFLDVAKWETSMQPHADSPADLLALGADSRPEHFSGRAGLGPD
jgi:hypothetical protein